MQQVRTSAQLKSLDTALLAALEKASKQPSRKTAFRNAEISALAKRSSTLEDLRILEGKLQSAGSFEVDVERRPWKDSDGEVRAFTLVRAARTDMWPMGTNYWVRDNVLIGARLLFGNRGKKSVALGRELLLSALTFMSSKAQLARFEAVISSHSRRVIDSPRHWPVIFAAIADNLHAETSERWAHKQEAWQMLAWHILAALESGLISWSEITRKHKRFLGLIIPFLGKVRFWQQENSGSWEEIAAVRTSVIAWEHRLVVRMEELSHTKDFRFIEKDFKRYRAYFATKLSKKSLGEFVAWMDREATQVALQRMPYESPHYDKRDPRYRKADAALIYTLQLDYPSFIAARAGKSSGWTDRMEQRILRLVEGLHDPRTGGVRRYHLDSYQRRGFFRFSTVQKLAELYGKPSGDASKHMTGRHRIVPKGREAAWTHFVWQLSAWAGRRFLEKGESTHRKLHDFYFREGLRLITGTSESSIDQSATGDLRVIPIGAFLMPECYVSDVSVKGEDLVFPSPHTPLNWAVGEMCDAFGVRRQVIKKDRQN